MHSERRRMPAAQLNQNLDRVYVIGDIHGRSDLLDKMVALICNDLNCHPANNCLTVTVGDYVDRGPDSRGVLDRLVRNPFPTAYVALKGNHEALLGAFLQDPMVAEHWRRLGGLETLHSYGVSVQKIMVGEDYGQAAKALHANVPEDHFKFLSSLETSFAWGRYFICHAGVRPGIPLERQDPEDLLWIRDLFLKSTMDFGRVVIHGHTPTERPEILTNRINIDTGAFATGRLTCVVLGDSAPRFLMTASI